MNRLVRNKSGHISLIKTVLRDGKHINSIPLGNGLYRCIYKLNNNTIWITAKSNLPFSYDVVSMERLGNALQSYK